jgi:hypothetical protein
VNVEQTWTLPLDSKTPGGEWRWVPAEHKPGATGWWRNNNTETLRWFPAEIEGEA